MKDMYQQLQTTIDNFTHTREEMEYINSLIVDNEKWGMEFIAKLIQVNDSSVFKKINIHSLIDYAFHNKQDLNLRQLLESASEQSIDPFYGILAMINKIDEIKQSQQEKARRGQDPKYFSLSETTVTNGCQHILFSDPAVLINLVAMTHQRHEAIPLTPEYQQQIEKIISRPGKPSDDSKSALSFLIETFEKANTEVELLKILHKIRQQWQMPLDLSAIPNISVVRSNEKAALRAYYCEILKNLTQEERQASFHDRQKFFIQCDFSQQPVEFIQDLFKYEKCDIREFLLKANFSDIGKIVSNIIPAELYHDNKYQTLMTLNLFLNCIEQEVDDLFFSFVFQSIKKLMGTPELPPNQEQNQLGRLPASILDDFKAQIEMHFEIHVFANYSLTEKHEKEKNKQKTLLYAAISKSDHVALRLLTKADKESSVIDLKKNVFWCFDEIDESVKQFFLDSEIKDQSNFLYLYTSGLISADLLKQTDAITTLHISDDNAFDTHPFLELLNKTLSDRKAASDYIVDCIKKCRNKSLTPFNGNLLSTLVIRMLVKGSMYADNVEYLIGDKETGANPNFVLENTECIPTRWMDNIEDIHISITELILTIINKHVLYINSHRELVMESATRLIANGANYLGRSELSPSILELYWESLDPSHSIHWNVSDEDKYQWLVNYHNWLKTLPKRRDIDHQYDSGLISKLYAYSWKHRQNGTSFSTVVLSKLTEIFDYLLFDLEVTFSFSRRYPHGDKPTSAQMLLFMINSELTQKILANDSPHQHDFIQELNKQSDALCTFKMLNKGIEKVLLSLPPEKVTYTPETLNSLLSIWFYQYMEKNEIFTLILNRKELIIGRALEKDWKINYGHGLRAALNGMDIPDNVNLMTYAVIGNKFNLLKSIIDSKYEKQHNEIFGNLKHHSAFLVSLVVNTYDIEVECAGEKLICFPPDAGQSQTILNHLIDNIRPKDPIISLLINYTSYINKTRGYTLNKEKAFECLNKIIDKLDSSHFIAVQPPVFDQLIKSFIKHNFSDALWPFIQKFNHLISNSALSRKDRQVCFDHFLRLIKHIQELSNQRILIKDRHTMIDTLQSHMNEQFTFSISKTTHAEQLLDYFTPNYQYGATIVTHYLISTRFDDNQKRNDLLLFWMKFDPIIDMTVKGNIRHFLSTIDTMKDGEIQRLFETPFFDQFWMKHFLSIFQYIIDNDRLSILKRIMVASGAQSHISIPERHLAEIALWAINNCEIKYLKLLLSQEGFNLSPKATLAFNWTTLPLGFNSLEEFNQYWHKPMVIISLFEVACYKNKSTKIIELLCQYITLQEEEKQTLLSNLDKIYGNESLGIKKIITKLPFERDTTPEDLKQYFTLLAETHLKMGNIRLIMTYLGATQNMLHQIEEQHETTVKENIKQKKDEQQLRDETEPLFTKFMDMYYASCWRRNRQALTSQQREFSDFWLHDGRLKTTQRKIDSSRQVTGISGNRLIHILTHRREDLSTHPMIRNTLEYLSLDIFDIKDETNIEQLIKFTLLVLDVMDLFITQKSFSMTLDGGYTAIKEKYSQISEFNLEFIKQSIIDTSGESFESKQKTLLTEYNNIWQGEKNETAPAFVIEVMV